MELHGLSQKSTALRGGYLSLMYAATEPDENWMRVVDADGKLLVSPSGINHWLTFPAVVVASRNYTISSSETKQGELYDITISGIMNDVTTVALAEFRRMKRLQFAVRISNYEDTWLMLDINNPATFSFTVEGGDIPSNRARIKFTFKGKTSEPPVRSI